MQGLLGQDAGRRPSPARTSAAQSSAAAHRAELAERRHVAARGKSGWNCPPPPATAQISTVLRRAVAAALVQTLLRQAWADALTPPACAMATIHRSGRNDCNRPSASPITAQAIDARGGTDTALAADVEVLLQVGYHAEEAAAVARRLATPGGEDESTSRTELSARLKARARLGEHAGTPTGTSPATPRSSAEEAAYQQLSTPCSAAGSTSIPVMARCDASARPGTAC